MGGRGRGRAGWPEAGQNWNHPMGLRESSKKYQMRWAVGIAANFIYNFLAARFNLSKFWIVLAGLFCVLGTWQP